MPDSDNLYIAIIADIIASRALPNRAACQQLLEEFLLRLNNTQPKAIVSRFIITIGDEFQGLLRADAQEALVDIWRSIDAAAFPFHLRMAIGCGKIDTALKTEAVGMDGPAFHRARHGLEHLKQHGGSLTFQTGNDKCDMHLNTIAVLWDAVRSSWTKRQRAIYASYRNSKSQRDLAQAYGVSPSAISRMLKRMHASQLDSAEANLMAIISECLPRLPNS